MKPNTVNIPVDKRESEAEKGLDTYSRLHSVLVASSIDESGK